MSGTVCPLTWILVLLIRLKAVLSVLILPSFLDGVCDLCGCFIFFWGVTAVRAFSLACPADYCFILTYYIYCHSWQNKRERES